ncbi:MAG TPA: M28 family peptidase [Pyrinomonadaceae bacterium]|nr:M28 family peptidase [Pyrinomonadaceae bacterium]
MIDQHFVSTPSVRAAERSLPVRLDCAVAIAIALLLALLIGFSIYAQAPPSAAPAGASAASFSASRALQHLSVIAAQPHPSGSAAQDRVRDYLMRELKAAGLEPQIQHSFLYRPNHGAPNAGIQNVLARLKGTGSGRAVLLAAHYDSRQESSGASDDGAAVGTLLETLRTLKAGEPLKNDVIFLFTDAEEDGMLGSQAFVAEHDWARDVGVVLNFEARGNSGPVMMFESSDQNGWLINEFAKAVPMPFAHSLSYEIYRLLPNDTDLTTFKEAGLPGLNFAHIDGIAHYHSPEDNLSAVDVRTVQHQGSYAVALTRDFGNVDLDQTSNHNAVYFDLFGRVLVHYSYVWVLPLTLLAGVLFVGVLVLGFRKHKLTSQELVWGAATLLASIVVAAVAGFLLWKSVWIVAGSPSPETLQSRLFLVGFVALALAATGGVYAVMRKRASFESFAVGALLCWLLLTFIVSIRIPGGSFLFHWPLLAGMAGLGYSILVSDSKKIGNMFIVAVCAVPAIVLWVPVIYQIFIGLTLNWVPLTIAMVVLLVSLLLPLFAVIAAPFKRALDQSTDFVF